MTPADLARLRDRLHRARRLLLEDLLAEDNCRHPSPSITSELARIEAALATLDREVPQ